MIATILQTGDNLLLIIEDDPHYASVLCDLSHDNGFKVLIANTGAEGSGAGPRVSSNCNLTRCLPA